jgi:hypothetical protein
MRELLMNAMMPNMQGTQAFGEQQGGIPNFGMGQQFAAPAMPQFDMYGQQQGGLRQALMMRGRYAI